MRNDYLQECPDILRGYLGYTETVKGRSSSTMDEYFSDLRTFFRYIKQSRGLVPSPAPDFEKISILDVDLEFLKTVTLNDVYEFLNFAKNERHNSAKTLARKASSLRMFFGYLCDKMHYLDANPVANLDTPKIPKRLPRYLTLEQSRQLLDQVDGEFALRDYCMLTLLLNCGLRRAELAALNLSDIGTDRTLRVHGKGNKERIVYLNDACVEAIRQYLPSRPVDGVPAKDKDALFLSRLKQRISLQGVHLIVKGYLKQVDGAENFSTHTLRHTAATLMYQHGHVDVRVLKDILGHETLATTEIYTHLSNEQIRRASESNPLAHVAKKRSSKHSPSEPDSAPAPENASGDAPTPEES